MSFDLMERFAEVGSQQKEKDPIVIAKFFDPQGAGTWLATEYDATDRVFFGYATIFEGEWGYFSLDELEAYTGRFGVGIERDLHCGEVPMSKHSINALRALGRV